MSHFGAGNLKNRGRDRASPRPRRGFTLIELLVTLTVFAAALSALIAGMRAGIRTWRSVRTHQVREAALHRALEVVGQDLRHLVVIAEGEAAALGSRTRQRAGLDAVWRRVEYRAVTDDATGAPNFVRSAQPYVGLVPLGDGPREEVLLQGVDGLRFDYGSREGAVPVWENADALPAVITVTIERDRGGDVVKTVWCPAGALGSGAGES